MYTSSERMVLFRLAAQHINGFSHMEIHLNPDRRISESDLLMYSKFVKHLKQGIPVQYIMGYTWFLDLKIGVNDSVLIPRPETEELVHSVIPYLNQTPKARILDACTGSGCIAIALKAMYHEADVYAFDVSAEALQTANQNAKDNATDINFSCVDIFQELPYSNAFDLIISNPPYIPEKEKSEMSNRVLDHEPYQALFVPDENPFVFYEQLVNLGNSLLKPNGMIALECHFKGVESTSKILMDLGFKNVTKQQDLSGNWRFVSGNKPG